MDENTLYGELREWHGPRKCNKCGTVRTFTFVVPHSLGSEPTIMPRETCDGEWLPYDRRKPHERRKGDRRAHPAPKGDMVDDLIDRLREETCSEDDGGVPFYDASLADDIIREYFANFLALVGAGGRDPGCTCKNLDIPWHERDCPLASPPQETGLRDVMAERAKQDAKWGEQNHDPFHYLTILMEEVGELSQAALHMRHGGRAALNVRMEAVHTAAVAVAIIECLDRGKWEWGNHATPRPSAEPGLPAPQKPIEKRWYRCETCRKLLTESETFHTATGIVSHREECWNPCGPVVEEL